MRVHRDSYMTEGVLQYESERFSMYCMSISIGPVNFIKHMKRFIKSLYIPDQIDAYIVVEI